MRFIQATVFYFAMNKSVTERAVFSYNYHEILNDGYTRCGQKETGLPLERLYFRTCR